MSPLNWQKASNQAGSISGEAGGWFVTADGFTRRAYLKPVNPGKGKVARAAREKIAADLAFDLELPVPPAVLTERKNPPQDCTPSVVVSLVMYPRQWPWEQIRNRKVDESPVGLALAKVLASCSEMLAFDTWLAQSDHGDHPHNIIWGYDPADLKTSELVFLDFAFSMGHNGRWADGGWNPVTPVPFPRLIRDHIDTKRLESCLSKIESYNENGVESIVTRVPEEYLPQSERDVIVKGLVGRRSSLRDALSAFL